MAREKISLRAFQESLSAKLHGLAQSAPSTSKLGLRVGAESWLVDMADVSEVVPVTTLAHAPLTRPWFAGIANIRGNLFSIVDFSAFMGGEVTPINMDSRLLLVNPKFMMNAGLVVNRMLGLRNPELFQLKATTVGAAPWVVAEYTDASGQEWKELNVRELIHHPDFLRVGL